MKKLEDVLDQCLDEIRSGRASIDDCLEKYPDLRDKLEPLFRLALRLPPLLDVHPSEEFRARARLALQDEMAPRRIFSRLAQGLPRIPHPGAVLRPRFATPLLIALLVTIFVLGGSSAVVFASPQSLPGDLLYPVKTAAEQGRLLITFSQSDKAEYRLELARRRLDEVLGLAHSGRSIDPGTVEAIANQVDAALADLRKASPKDIQAILGSFSSDIEKKKSDIEEAKKQGSPDVQQQLDQTDVLIQRGHLITKSISEDPSRLQQPASVRAAKESEIKGTISSLNPLKIAGLQIALSSDTKVVGTLAVGKIASVKGIFRDDGTLLASHIEVAQGGEPSRVELKGVITSLDPMVVAGWKIAPSRDTEIKGTPQIGLIASVRGRMQDDGSVLASNIEVERLREETTIQGVVISVDPLMVGDTVIALAPGAATEGTFRIGIAVEAKGKFLDNGQFLASNIKVLEEKKGGEKDKPKDRQKND